MKDAQPVGTSPEVLQHYLTAGIDIKTPDHVGKLVGLNHGRFQSPVELDIEAIDIGGHLGGLCYYPYELCLPILKPFNQLCTPLEDGTVPAAIDFVRSFVTDQYGMDWSEAHIDKVYENGDIMVSIPDRHPTRYDHYYVLHADWAGLPLEAYAWLIKNHFAVGLQPHQYIEKTPAAAPIIQEGTSQPE